MLSIKKTKTHANYNKTKKDPKGYIKNNQNWSIYLAEEIARKEKIILTDDHWEIIYFIREFYFKYNITPSMRMLINGIKKKMEKKFIVFIYSNYFLKVQQNKLAK